MSGQEHPAEAGASASAPVPPAEAADAEPSLRDRAIRGAAITLGGHALAQVIRVVQNVWLAALLSPSIFALMALVGVVQRGTRMLSDLGLGASLVQHERGEEPEFRNTVWTIQVIRGVVLWGIVFALTEPITRFFEATDPEAARLRTLLPVCAFGLVIQGFAATALFTENRRLRLGRIVVVNTSAQVVGLVVMIGYALWSPTVWALVVGNLVTGVVITAGSWAVDRSHRDRFHFDPGAARAVLTFGGWIFVSTGLLFATAEYDRVFIGRMLPLEILGVYHVATTLATVPREVVNRVAERVLFPVVSDLFREGGTGTERVHRARRATLLVGGWLTAGVAIFGPAFFDLLYDDRYASAGWIAQLLCASVWITMLAGVDRSIVLASGRSRPVALANGVSLAGMVVAAGTGFREAGLAGLIVGLAVGQAAGYAVILGSMRGQRVRIGLEGLWITLATAAVIAIGVLVDRSMAAAGFGPIGRGLAAAAPFAVVTLVVVRVAGREVGIDPEAILRRLRRRRPSTTSEDGPA